MQKIPCEVIKDLLPSYVDGLTSAETNRLVKEHLASCGDCRRLFEAMQAPLPETEAIPFRVRLPAARALRRPLRRKRRSRLLLRSAIR